MRPSHLAVILLLLGVPARAEVPAVLADIPPVHSLAAAVMEGLGEPALLMPPGVSPHDFALRPSEARAVANAEVIFTVGVALSPALGDALSAAEGASVITLLDVPGTRLHASGGPAETRGAGALQGDGGAQTHDHGGGHDHGTVDPHAWLDPANARVWLTAMAEAMAANDPSNAAAYAENASKAAAAVAEAAAEAQRLLAPVGDRPVVVLHDAFVYWQEAFGMPQPLAISASDAVRPGPARLSALRQRMREDGIACIMGEPQFDAKLVALVAEGSDARLGLWDPLGSSLPAGPALYPTLLTDLARAYAECAGN